MQRNESEMLLISRNENTMHTFTKWCLYFVKRVSLANGFLYNETETYILDAVHYILNLFYYVSLAFESKEKQKNFHYTCKCTDASRNAPYFVKYESHLAKLKQKETTF